MLVVAGTIVIDPAKRPEAEAAFERMREATLKEPGCLAYQAYFDRKNPGVIFMFEKWDSEEALTAHFSTPHMADFGGAMADFGVKETDIRKLQVAAESKLM